jgi:hypothetical protein
MLVLPSASLPRSGLLGAAFLFVWDAGVFLRLRRQNSQDDKSIEARGGDQQIRSKTVHIHKAI